MMKSFAVIAALAATASATVLYSEDFSEGWEDRWTVSEAKGDLGKFVASEDGGIKTSEDAKFYGLATTFDKFSNTGKDLVVRCPEGHGGRVPVQHHVRPGHLRPGHPQGPRHLRLQGRELPHQEDHLGQDRRAVAPLHPHRQAGQHLPGEH